VVTHLEDWLTAAASRFPVGKLPPAAKPLSSKPRLFRQRQLLLIHRIRPMNGECQIHRNHFALSRSLPYSTSHQLTDRLRRYFASCKNVSLTPDPRILPSIGQEEQSRLDLAAHNAVSKLTIDYINGESQRRAQRYASNRVRSPSRPFVSQRMVLKPEQRSDKIDRRG
jgi:hypothetical protein